MRVAGPVLLTIATTEVARRLSEQPDSLPALSSRRPQARARQADPAAVIVIQIVQRVTVVSGQTFMRSYGYSRSYSRPSAPDWTPYDD
jgi:hypothetical protein